MRLKISGYFAALLCMGMTMHAEAHQAKPETFLLETSGFFGIHASVELMDNGKLRVYDRLEDEAGREPYSEISVTDQAWQEFRSRIDAINPWDWKSKYRVPNIPGGENWKLHLSYPDNNIVSGGSNGYPDATEAARRSASFKALLRAVSILIDRNFAGVSQHEANANSDVPSMLVFRIGSYGWGGWRSVRLIEDTLIYDNEKSNQKLVKIPNISARQWRAFRKALDKANVWQWTGNYMNDAVDDGTQWELHIEYGKTQIHAKGSNAYPNSDGSSTDDHDLEYTPAFKQLLKALGTLAGKPF